MLRLSNVYSKLIYLCRLATLLKTIKIRKVFSYKIVGKIDYRDRLEQQWVSEMMLNAWPKFVH